MVELKDVVVGVRDSVEVEYEDTGFIVKLRPLTRAQVNDINKRCSKRGFDRRTHQPTEVLDDKKFAKEMDESSIADWSGLTPMVIRRLIPTADISEKVSSTEEIPCSSDAKRFLMEQSGHFSRWVVDVIMDAGSFVEIAEEAETKNSVTSPDGKQAAAPSLVTSASK